eukprot:631871_1
MSSSFMLNIDLSDLNEPCKLAQWMCELSKHNTDTTRDNRPHSDHCQLLPQFIYESQLSGSHIKTNFTETDFKCILRIIHDGKKYDYSNDYQWIWNIIKRCQSINKYATRWKITMDYILMAQVSNYKTIQVTTITTEKSGSRA